MEESEQTATRGLAADEFLVSTHADGNSQFPATLRLYTFKDHVALCGRFQDISAEIDMNACLSQNYGFSRRLTGGGAIIMGQDQLGICLATHSEYIKWEHIRELYVKFSQPILLALKEFGIEAVFRSKNDIEVSGKKIAGLGVYVSPEGGIQFHTSLVYDLDIPKMLSMLQIPVQKYSDKVMVRSVEQRMTTVIKELVREISMIDLKKKILEKFSAVFNVEMVEQGFSEPEAVSISALEDSKYKNPEWIFQHSPLKDMDGVGIRKCASGLLRTYIALKGDSIKSVMITGDYMEKPSAFSRIETDLKWSVLDREKIDRVISNALSDEADCPFSAEEITESVWLAVQRAHAANKYTYKGSCYYPKELTNA